MSLVIDDFEQKLCLVYLLYMLLVYSKFLLLKLVYDLLEFDVFLERINDLISTEYFLMIYILQVNFLYDNK